MLWSSGWTASAFVVLDADVLSVLSARYLIVVIVLSVTITVLRQWRVMKWREVQHHLTNRRPVSCLVSAE